MDIHKLRHIIQTDIYGLLEDEPKEMYWKILTRFGGGEWTTSKASYKKLHSVLIAKQRCIKNGFDTCILRINVIDGEHILVASEK